MHKCPDCNEDCDCSAGANDVDGCQHDCPPDDGDTGGVTPPPNYPLDSPEKRAL